MISYLKRKILLSEKCFHFANREFLRNVQGLTYIFSIRGFKLKLNNLLTLHWYFPSCRGPGCRTPFYSPAYEGHRTPRGNCNYSPRPHFSSDPWSLYDWRVWKQWEFFSLKYGNDNIMKKSKKGKHKRNLSINKSYLGLSCLPNFSGCLGSGQGEGSVSDMCSSDSELGRTSCSLYWCGTSGVTGALYSQRLVGQWSWQLCNVCSKLKQ